jgi:hypothetical protein
MWKSSGRKFFSKTAIEAKKNPNSHALFLRQGDFIHALSKGGFVFRARLEPQPPFAMKPGTPVAITELSLLLV